ncbi:beta-ketoacyl-[acyl-carrier-protein] synthase family protein [Krasilnikovia sp. MM14-A1259]|uniref:beta-ketoacyl-[acyl-carrier-protein] synthase family protein n=1 Tax=Krasilnikovia sp. MM14-A1259 TaxID=3373539 RepID=UPI0037FE64D7
MTVRFPAASRDGTRVALTGMSVVTPLADTLDGFHDALVAGRSAIARWRSIPVARSYCKIGGDLGDYDVAAAVRCLEGLLDEQTWCRLRNFTARLPWGTAMGMLCAARAALDARWFGSTSADRTALAVAGHNLTSGHVYRNAREFETEPDFIDGLLSLSSLDTDHAGCVSEVLNLRGPIYTVGGACASGNHALRMAVDEIRHHGMRAAFVVAPPVDFSPVDLHAMALIGAVSHTSFNDTPALASRPFDRRREGFVPAHGCGALVLEEWEHASSRGARIYAEVVGVEANAHARRDPQPCAEAQTALTRRLLDLCGLAPEQIDYISAHATSTPLGDITEIRSIREVFGAHAPRLKINATKSMIGHTTWSAPTVEIVAAVLQMRAGRLHPSINIDDLDEEIDLDVCRGGATNHAIGHLMKNSFGFGGTNCVAILRNPEAE